MKEHSVFKAHWIGISWQIDHAGEMNKYYAFRNECNLTDDISEANIKITADSRFIFYVNGNFVGRGPARSFPEKQSYETYDIGKYLKKGPNALAVLVHRLGTSTGQYINRGRTGLLVYGEIISDNGSKTVIKTDLDWKVKEADWYKSTSTRYTSQLGFQEIVDNRINSQDWLSAGFDEEKNGWKQVWFIGPAGIHPWIELEPTGLKPLIEKEIKGKYSFSALCRAEEGIDITGNIIDYWPDNEIEVIDSGNDQNGWVSIAVPEKNDLIVTKSFDYVLAGYPDIEIKDAPENGIVDIYYHINCEEDGQPVLNRGFSTKWDGPADRLICKSGYNKWESYSVRGFSMYTCIFRGFNKVNACLKGRETHYPVEDKGEFICSDSVLNSVWNITGRTLKSTMLDAHVDNPWREQVQWLADGILAGLGAFSTFGNGDLLKRGLRQWGYRILPDGILNSGAPMENNYYGFVDYTLLWVRGIWLHYLYTGDIGFLKECTATLEIILNSFSNDTTEENLYVAPEGYLYFVDWTNLSRVHYAFTLNAMLLEAYEHAVMIFNEVHNSDLSKLNRGRAELLRETLEKKFWSESSKCWVEYLSPCSKIKNEVDKRIQPDFPQGWVEDPETFKGSGPGSMHGNTIALFLKLGNKTQQQDTFSFMRKSFNREDEINYFSPLWIEKVFSTLFDSDNKKEAFLRIKEIFKRWVEQKVTTWPETFGDLENINNIFSGVGTAQETASCINNILHRYILGIYPCSGGFKTFNFNPYPGDLDFLKGKVPTPSGDIIVECTKKGEKLIGTINVPDGLCGTAVNTEKGDIKFKSGVSSFIWNAD